MAQTAPHVEFDLNINASDMDKEWITRSTEFVKNGLTSCRSEKALASFIKSEFDKSFGYGWNVIVGKRFGSHVFHKTKMYLFMNVRDLYILVWQS